MRNAARILTFLVGALALGACHNKPQQTAAANEDMSVGDNLAAGRLPANVQIETLPPDESSGTSNGELSKGDDNPDVNDLGNSN